MPQHAVRNFSALRAMGLALAFGAQDVQAMTETAPDPRLRLRVVFGDGAMIGPGKADLLERIRDTGSISAAGRAMGMSYKRAWMLVETLNALFREPLVESTRGGAQGGGAHLTDAGTAVLALYRRMEARATEAAADDIATIHGMLRDISSRK